MRLIALTAVSALALGAAACAPHIDYAHKTALDCPDRQGELQRTGVAADRKSCTYQARGGAEITLQLTPVVNGDAGATLSAIEASLAGPATPEPAAKAAEAPAKGAKAAPAPPTPPAPPATGGNDAERAAREAAGDAAGGRSAVRDDDWNRHDKDTVTINGKAVVEDDGHSSHVRLPGLHIDAEGDNAKLDIAGLHIDANDDHQTVKMVRDVRLRGEAFSREKRGLRAFFIAKRQDLPDGYRFVGYQASGPKTGPLTVAVVKSREELDHGDRLYRDIQRLVRLNGGA
jgi:hypothetical protein